MLLIKRQDSPEKWIVASSSELASPHHQPQEEFLTFFWSGNPHPTGKDPLHVSGVIGKSSIKGKNRVTSFHAYPDGRVRFSDKALEEIKVVQDSSTSAGGSGNGAKK